jgi:hypothetical protein
MFVNHQQLYNDTYQNDSSRSEDSWRLSKKTQCMEHIILSPQRRDGPYSHILALIPWTTLQREGRTFMHMQSVAKYVQSQSKLDTHTLARGL